MQGTMAVNLIGLCDVPSTCRVIPSLQLSDPGGVIPNDCSRDYPHPLFLLPGPVFRTLSANITP